MIVVAALLVIFRSPFGRRESSSKFLQDTVEVPAAVPATGLEVRLDAPVVHPLLQSAGADAELGGALGGRQVTDAGRRHPAEGAPTSGAFRVWMRVWRGTAEIITRSAAPAV